MNVGIIAEYNPFHKGHRLHIESTRLETGADNIIVLMSGSFVQRGEPAVADKFTRTKAALLNGADMILELPVEYATGSADVFAKGAVEILDKSGIVDILSFGTETGELKPFMKTAELLLNEPANFKACLHSELEKGIPYPAARQAALSQILSMDMSFLSRPNNILALEYIKALLRLQSTIKPFTVKRQINDYNSEEMSGEISSASAIRQCLYKGEIKAALSAVPLNCHNLFDKTKKLPHIDRYTDILRYILLTKDPLELGEIDGIAEGLENRISAYVNLDTVTEIAEAVKSKRYTLSRIRRSLLHIILDIKKEEVLQSPRYIRVLGFRRSKAHLVGELAKKSSLPVITNVKNAPVGLEREIFATHMYYLPLTGESGKDFTESPVIID